MKIYRKLAAVTLGAALVLGASAASCESTGSVEVEDCDAEDRRNKEAECGFTDSDRRKTPVVKKTPTVKKTRR